MAIILLVAACFVLLGFLIAAVSGAPWVPARSADITKVFKDIDLNKNTVLIELGCGDGRVALAAAKRGAKVTGYEINPVLWVISVYRTRRFANVKIKLANFWKTDLSSADIVMAFLIPRTMPRLAAKVKKEMRPGARLASYVFTLPGKRHVKLTSKWYIYEF